MQILRRITDINERTKDCSPNMKKRALTLIQKEYYPALLMTLKTIEEAGGPVELYIDLLNSRTQKMNDEVKLLAK